MDDPEVVKLFMQAYEFLEDCGAIPACGMEADDLLAIWQTENPGVIVSVDKDMLQVKGLHFNIRDWKYQWVTEDEADYLLMKQVLTGDSVDNIKGLAGIGPVKADACLKDVPYGKRLDAVKKLWKEKYGRGWEANMQLNMDLIYLRRTHTDTFNIKGM